MRYLFTILLSYLTSSLAVAQTDYETGTDPKHPEVKVLKGLINKQLLQNDTSFRWYKTNSAGYTPDSVILNAFIKNKDSLHFVVFGGTWCDDTQFILPRFFSILEMSGIADTQVTLFGVNREKASLGNISGAFRITNVPTIIVMRNGKESGRLVEYGKTGNWDSELASILSGN